MNKQVVLEIIEDYIWELKEPRCCWDTKRFRQASYSLWAANEFYYYVEKIENLQMSDLEQFVHLMDDLSCWSKKSSYMFSVGKDIAEDILDVIMAQI